MKTTNDLLVLRSDVYDLGEPTSCSTRSPTTVPFVDLDARYYKLVGDFDERFPEGVAVAAARPTSLRGRGRLDLRRRRHGRRAGHGSSGDGGRVEAGTTLSAARVATMAANLMPTDRLSTVDEHVERILEALEPLPALRPAAAGGARAPGLPRTSPRRSTCRRFDNSAMDGYAVCYDDVATRLRRTTRCTCRWSARSAAGQTKLLALSPGHRGQDHDRRPGAAGRRRGRAGRVDRRRRRARCGSPGRPSAASTCGTAGEDVADGRRAARGRHASSARASSACSPSVGRSQVRSRPRPRVVVMSTGAELREPGHAAGPRLDLRRATPTCSPPPPAPPARSPTASASSPTTRATFRDALARPAGARRPRGHQRRRQQGRLRRGQGGARPSSARSGSARSRCSPASRRASASSARTRPRSSRCRATRSRRTSPSRCSCCPRSAG